MPVLPGTGSLCLRQFAPWFFHCHTRSHIRSVTCASVYGRATGHFHFIRKVWNAAVATTLDLLVLERALQLFVLCHL